MAANFCTNCGEQLKVVKSCPNCGRIDSPTDKFCRNCGKKLSVAKFCFKCKTTVETGEITELRVDTPNPDYYPGMNQNNSPMAMMGVGLNGGMMQMQQMMMNGGFTVPQEQKTKNPIKNPDILQGLWRFEQPGIENPPEELQYTDMYMMIEGTNYTIVKDGVKVDSGNLVESYGHYESEDGKIYVFDEMQTRGLYGDEMTVKAESTYIELHREIRNPEEEFERVLSKTFSSIDLIWTDENNCAKYQLYIEKNTINMTICKDRREITIQDDTMDKIAENVKSIMTNSGLGKFGKQVTMPGEGIMADCFRLLYTTREGITWCIKIRDDIPEEVEHVASEISNLYQKYNLESHIQMSVKPEDLVGVWSSEDKRVNLVLGADGTYELGDAVGTYSVDKNSIIVTDLRGGWDMYDYRNRYENFSGFSSIKVYKDFLMANVFVSDYGNIPLRLYRR